MIENNDENLINESIIDTTIINETLPPVPSETDDMLDIAEMAEQHLKNTNSSSENKEKKDNDSFSLEQQSFDDEKEAERLWIARTGLDYDSLCGAIETIIFMTEKPISLNKIKSFIDDEIPLRVIFESILRLQGEYEAKHHGLRLVEVAEGYQFRTKATYSKFVQDIFKVNSIVLTPATLETLAVISYKQPVSRIELDKIRGVDSSHLIRGLMERRLVKIVGRSEDVGRPVLYGTTPEFLEVFNLNSIDDLPPERELNELSKKDTGSIKDIRSIVNSGDKTQFEFDESEELENLSNNIKNINCDTLFTQSLKIEDKKKKRGLNSLEEDQVIKSAFDIIEEFVWNKEISKVNEKSFLSECLSAYLDPCVISDLTQGPFNIPEIDDDDDDEFQMVDLDTGDILENREIDDNNAISCLSNDDIEFDIEVELEADQEYNKENEEENEEDVGPDSDQDLFMANYKEKEFEKLLDSNFESIVGEKLPQWDELSGDDVDQLDLKENEINKKIQQFSEDAEKLDIDLSLD